MHFHNESRSWYKSHISRIDTDFQKILEKALRTDRIAAKETTTKAGVNMK